MNPAAEYLDKIRNELGSSWLPQLYVQRVLKLRTRAYEFPPMPQNASPHIHHTLLGIELKAGRRRMLCPDLATARYLSVFARIGCRGVAIPYDITKISLIADELDSSWHQMLLISARITANRKAAFRARVRRRIIVKVRDEIAKAGAGPRVPEFKESPRERKL
ncbi:MAG: hypothetical protein ABR607_03995 [Pyrinomonadaceae bacterium]